MDDGRKLCRNMTSLFIILWCRVRVKIKTTEKLAEAISLQKPEINSTKVVTHASNLATLLLVARRSQPPEPIQWVARLDT